MKYVLSAALIAATGTTASAYDITDMQTRASDCMEAARNAGDRVGTFEIIEGIVKVTLENSEMLRFTGSLDDEHWVDDFGGIAFLLEKSQPNTTYALLYNNGETVGFYSTALEQDWAIERYNITADSPCNVSVSLRLTKPTS